MITVSAFILMADPSRVHQKKQVEEDVIFIKQNI
jgi:hypothetical protein